MKENEKSNVARTEKNIESVENFSYGVTTSEAPRKKLNLLAVKYADGSEESFQIAGKCHAFLNTGFLTSSGKNWIFYSAGGNKIVEIAKNMLGHDVEILSVGCYCFRKDDDSRQYINANGEKFTLTAPCIGIPAKMQFDRKLKNLYGTWSKLMQMFKQIEEQHRTQAEQKENI